MIDFEDPIVEAMMTPRQAWVKGFATRIEAELNRELCAKPNSPELREKAKGIVERHFVEAFRGPKP